MRPHWPASLCCLLPLLLTVIVLRLPSVHDDDSCEDDLVSFAQRKVEVSLLGSRQQRPPGFPLQDVAMLRADMNNKVGETVRDMLGNTLPGQESGRRAEDLLSRAEPVISSGNYTIGIMHDQHDRISIVVGHDWGIASRFIIPNYDNGFNNIGLEKFFNSAVTEEWLLFFTIMGIFFLVQYCIMEWPSKHKYHGLAILIWFSLAAVCNMLIWWRFGFSHAVTWFSGYWLELTFSLENIFVFHIVMRAFRVPRKQAEFALTLVIFCQILFEMVFFMGLAFRLRQSQVLPYIVGLWLIYVGYNAGAEDAHMDVNFKETWVYSWSTKLLGSRLKPRYFKGDVTLVSFDGEKGFSFTLLFVATVCLVLVDFVLEIDVVLTKIEELRNHYLAFTSSAAAAFLVPELFFVCRDLFSRFYMLKFAISFVLVFFGVQLLLHRVISIPTVIQIAITIIAMVVCVVISTILPGRRSDLDADESDHMPSDGEQAEEWT